MKERDPIEEALLISYRLFFNSPHGRAVLLDLMSYCKFRVPTDGQIDEGKRQVFLRILERSQLPDENFIVLYSRITEQPEGESE